jgi:hypothetical protein
MVEQHNDSEEEGSGAVCLLVIACVAVACVVLACVVFCQGPGQDHGKVSGFPAAERARAAR